MFEKPTIEKTRKSLERMWDKLSVNQNSKLGILFVILMLTLYIKPIQALALEDDNEAILFFENKIAKNFSKKFCNSIAFGISNESSMEFAIGEIQKEISNKPILKNIDKDSLSYKISDEIIYNCGPSIGLKGPKGIEKLNRALNQMSLY